MPEKHKTCCLKLAKAQDFINFKLSMRLEEGSFGRGSTLVQSVIPIAANMPVGTRFKLVSAFPETSYIRRELTGQRGPSG